MPLIGGQHRQDWISANRGGYSPYSGYSAGKLAQDLSAFRKAAKQVSGTGVDKLVISYLHALVPWSSFYAKDCRQGDVVVDKQLTNSSMFHSLYMDLVESSSFDRSWRSAPVLRNGVRLLKSMTQSSSYNLYTNFRDKDGQYKNLIDLDGKEFVIQDVIRTRDNSVRKAVQSLEEFSLVATPYLERENIERSITGDSNTVHVYWPISSLAQLVL